MIVEATMAREPEPMGLCRKESLFAEPTPTADFDRGRRSQAFPRNKPWHGRMETRRYERLTGHEDARGTTIR